MAPVQRLIFGMQIRPVCATIVVCLLAGCTDTDWNNAMSFVGVGQSNTASTAVAPADTDGQPAPPAQAGATSESWCRRVAEVDMQNAAHFGFDAATQRQTAETSYRQCMSLSDSGSK